MTDSAPGPDPAPASAGEITGYLLINRDRFTREALDAALLARYEGFLRPEDKRCSAVPRAACEVFKLRCEFSDAMLVLMICGILSVLPLRLRGGN